MEAQSVEHFVTSAIASACNAQPSDLEPQLPLIDINMDSLALASVVGQVEAVYSVEFEPEHIMKMFHSATIADVIATVKQVLSPR